MKTLTLLLIPLIFLSSCTIDWNDNRRKIQEISIQSGAMQIQSLSGAEIHSPGNRRKDFGSGFVLLQSKDETTLSYSGTVVKIWTHEPPDDIPFVWDEGCQKLTDKLNKIQPDIQVNGKQEIWKSLTQDEKKDCIRESLLRNIDIETTVNSKIFLIQQFGYELSSKWIYNIENKQIAQVPIDGSISKISIGKNGMFILSGGGRGNDGGVLLLKGNNTMKKVFWNNDGTATSLSKTVDDFILITDTKVKIIYHEYDYKTDTSIKKEIVISI